MKKNFVVFSSLLLGLTALAGAQAQPAAAPAKPAATGPAPTKVAIINISEAMVRTKDGQVAANALQAKFAPRKADLDKKQASIAALQEQLNKGSATMSEDAKNKLMRDIDSGRKALTRDSEDAQSELDQEQGKIQQDLYGKMISIIEQYSTKNGYAVVLDVGSQQSGVVWAASAIDITPEIIKLYDEAHPTAAAPAAAPAPAAPKK